MEVKYIGLFKRFLAFIMDASIVLVLGGIISGILAVNFLSFREDSIVYSIILFVSLLYFTLMESSSRQATFGKVTMRIKVVNKNGEKVSFLNALGRNLVKHLSLVFAPPVLLIIPFNKKKQALHDMLVKTYIVKIENYEEYIQQQSEKVSSKIFALFGFALLGFLILMALISMFTSQIAKDIGNFMALVIGGAIWIGIFYGLYKLFKATGGDGEYLVSKMLANTLGEFRKQEYKVKQKGDLTSSSHRTMKSAVNMTKSAQNECSIYHENVLLGIWEKGIRKE